MNHDCREAVRAPARWPVAVAAGMGLAVAWPARVARAQGTHAEHAPVDLQGLVAGVSHGATLAACVFMAGLAAFVALVWLPASRTGGAGRDAAGLFVRWTWALFGLLVVAGVVELSVYAVRASGEPFSLGLLWEAVSGTRVGEIWLVRLLFGLLTASAVTFAARLGRPAYWWGAFGVGCVLLATLSWLSHAAAEGRSLPLLADWVHLVSGSLWTGGLLGFPLVLLGPLRAMSPDERGKLLRAAVRRFSRVATAAVLVLGATGLYAILLHVPDLRALTGTPYGRALFMKLGLLMFLLAAGWVNLQLQGREPFGRVVATELALAVAIFVVTGFLTSLPPPR